MKLRGKFLSGPAALPTDGWIPRTELGRAIKEKRIENIDEIFVAGREIKESEIVDALLLDLKQETIEITTTQRMTDSGRKQSYRTVVVVGNEKGYVGVAQGKAYEVRPSIEVAIKEAKCSLIKVNLGCGSWECKCGLPHSLPIVVNGSCGGVKVVLKPAPRGTGLVANDVGKKVLRLAGIKDIWSSARGRTRNVYNTAMAFVDAIDSLNKIRVKEGWK